MVFAAFKAMEMSHVFIALDAPGPTFRHEAMPQYKAQRPEVPEDLKVQWPMMKAMLDEFKIPYMELKGYEADDIIGTLAVKANATDEYERVMMVTNDMDFFQLIEGDIIVKTMDKFFRDSKEYDREGVMKKVGVYPEQIVDYKGLRGDTADNIPGVKGIGEKTATALLGEYGHLEKVYENLESLRPGVKKKLEDDVDNAYHSRDMAKIITDLDLGIELDSLKTSVVDCEAGRRALERYGFARLITQLGKIEPMCNDNGDQMSLFNDF
jgi:DNA polymerase-1